MTTTVNPEPAIAVSLTKESTPLGVSTSSSSHEATDSQSAIAAAGPDFTVPASPDFTVPAGPDFSESHRFPGTQPLSALADSIFDDGHSRNDAHGSGAVAGSISSSSQRSHEAQIGDVAAGATPLASQRGRVTHCGVAGETTSSPTAMGVPATTARAPSGHSLPASQIHLDTQSQNAGGFLFDPFLALAADVLDDAERNRISNQNRLRQLTRSAEDKDGEVRGFGLDESHPDVARLAAIVDMLAKVEHESALNLRRILRRHPLSPWLKDQKGIGEKQAARMLAVVGDPYWHDAANRPRTVSELWSYCGHGDPIRRRRRGMSQAELFACGSPDAKMRLHLIAEACLKAQGELAAVYYDRKTATEDRLHAAPCVRCGPSGKPAQPGTPWSPGHRHADALRLLGKEILRRLWLQSKSLYEESA